MPSPVDQQQAMAALAKLSQRDLARWWRRLDLTRPGKLADPLQDVLDALVARYGAGAASLAADWYDEARADAGVAGRFAAIPAPLPVADELRSLSRWGVGPLFGAEPDGLLALSLIGGGLQRMIAGMGRRTVEDSVKADPTGPRYARYASWNACAFCAMLATRGPVYHSEQTAGAKYHDHCHCLAVAVWPGQKYRQPPYVKHWDLAYAEARETGAKSTSDILSKMRQKLGSN